MSFPSYDAWLAHLDAIRCADEPKRDPDAVDEECDACGGSGRTGDGEDAEKWKCLACLGSGRVPIRDES